MKRFLLTVFAIALCGMAHAADSDYKLMLDTAAKIEADRAKAITAYHLSQQEKNEQLPQAIEACSKLKNEVSQMVCTLSVTGNLGGGNMNAAAFSMPPINLPAPTPQIPWYEKLWDKSLQVADRVIPIWLRHEDRKGQTEIARINAGVQIAGYQATTANFDIMGRSNTEIAVAALNRPVIPTTQWTFNGNLGPVNAGSGTQTNTTNTNSNNVTKNCQGGQAGSTTSTTSPGTGGSSPGGSC